MAALNQAKIIKGLEALTENLSRETFFLDFLSVYGTPKATVKALAAGNKSRNIAIEPGDVGLTKKIYCRAIESGDVGEALEALLHEASLKAHKMRFFVVTDFVKLAAYDARIDDSLEIDLADLRGSYDFFLPLTGQYEKPVAYSAHPADTKACEKMGRLYDIIKVLNQYDEGNLHDLNIFLTRLLFCFFAEDTGIFRRQSQMTDALEATTAKDGSDLPQFFGRLFEVLDLPENDERRKVYPATLQAFPYVNGGLFREKCVIPTMDGKARNLLLDCGRLTWSEISPVIFGSMFQSVMDPEQRHELGAHYTSEKNIFKVINPLFLDDLKEELSAILELKVKGVRKRRLEEFQKKLAGIRIADPACGCGNFLVVSYRELKTLELRAVEAILKTDENRDRSVFMDWQKDYSKVSIDQFYGIEIEEFPVDIARVSMWLMEHVMNCRFGELLGTVIPSIPLKAGAQIVCANALTTDWATVFPVKELSYIIGNPPFSGYQYMTATQKQEIATLFDNSNYSNSLDFVTGWFIKSARLISEYPNVASAFVTTNSICQGEQVAPLWSRIFSLGVKIVFAHRTFKWQNEAKNNAGVYCSIVGLARKEKPKVCRIYSYETPTSEAKMSVVDSISPYLVPGRNVFVVQAKQALEPAVPGIVLGNMPKDGGGLIVEEDEYGRFASIPKLEPYVRRLIGATELLYNKPRYCLWLSEAPVEILNIPEVKERLEQVRTMRLASKAESTRKYADFAHLFRQITQDGKSSCIVIPRVTSERRNYIPMGFLPPGTITTDLCFAVPNGTLYDFGILESRLHMTWMRTVCGRLESRYRYSRDLCYNTFPWPKVTEAQREVIENLAGNVLLARELHPEMTLADLYDPDKMPDDLRKAHAELDAAVESLYRKRPFESDEDRLHHLFERYEKLVKGEDSAELYDKD